MLPRRHGVVRPWELVHHARSIRTARPLDGPCMSETTTIGIEVPTATAEQLDALARSTNRSPAALARQTLDQFLEVEAWHAAAIDGADAGGPFVAHEDMVRWLESWGTENELPPPGSTIRR